MNQYKEVLVKDHFNILTRWFPVNSQSFYEVDSKMK